MVGAPGVALAIRLAGASFVFAKRDLFIELEGFFVVQRNIVCGCHADLDGESAGHDV